MRRTAIIIAIVAFLFGSAAYGSKKPRTSTAPAASHKKLSRSAKRAQAGESVREGASPHRRSSAHAISLRPWRRKGTAVRPSFETYGPPDPTPAVEPAVVESASIHSSRLLMPPPLRGSRESLVRQNERSEEADGLERIEDDEDLADRIAGGMLVPVPVSSALSVNANLPENRRYCRPWTASFLSDLARAHVAQFHTPLLVTSAVRTVEYQKELERINGNAAAAEGDIASPHLTGGTIDIAKQGMSRQQIAWMRARLLPLQTAGKIDVEEEFHQSCFHITVYKSYVPPAAERAAPAQASSTDEPSLTGSTATRTGAKLKKTVRQKPHRSPAQTQPPDSEPGPQSPAPAAPPQTPVEGL